MKLGDVWMAYCEDRLVGVPSTFQPEAIPPWRGVELMFDWHPIFTPRHDAMESVRYSLAFDDEADGALCQLAMADSFAGWDAISAGAWRVIYERHVFATVVMLANEKVGRPIIAHLPRGLDRRSQSRALGLMFLLGGARTIDRELLPSPPDGSLPAFPAGTPLRRQ